MGRIEVTDDRKKTELQLRSLKEGETFEMVDIHGSASDETYVVLPKKSCFLKVPNEYKGCILTYSLNNGTVHGRDPKGFVNRVRCNLVVVKDETK